MDLIHKTLEWWMSLQSPERDLNMCLPLPNYMGDMHWIRKKGQSRMVLVMFLVWWWGTIVLESKMASRHWKEFMADISTCLLVMVSGPGALPA